jgi:CBS domain-containing protein
MAVPPSLTPHRISYLRTVGDDPIPELRGHVFCTRLGQTLRTEECARCPRFVRVSPGATSGEDAVICDTRSGGLLPIAEAQTPLALARVPVSALMTRNVICVRPELSLDAATRLFIESGLKAVPVVEPRGALRGFISEAEVILAVQLENGANPASTIADIMLPFALALPETASVTQAAAVLAFEGQARLAVVSATGALVGVLSASDIMYWLARSDGHLLPRPRPC